ncbi:MAG: hypothetical protein A6F72_07510 [Cycloclasticus sp. symbiont of Poecilosclerida sp. N]|nr:MAG: hypothetical protein A6F72_07510 [Cycloclasticus sp. symbiont of Poecilosclerida sp. N]
MNLQEIDKGTLRRTKINKLLVSVPAGTPVTSTWLASQGISPQLVHRYKRSGWLEPLARSAWVRAGGHVSMAGAVFALQQQLLIKVYPAARTALELQGRAHYIATEHDSALQLSLESGQKLPTWFTRQSFSSNLSIFNSSALFNPTYAGLDDWQNEELQIKISSAERAMLEYCHLLPKCADFEEARQLMEGLTTLRPKLLQSTLLACKSIKAKRLFLVLASVVGHTWYKQLDIESLELGAGNRSVMADGCLHPQFKITVPKDWVKQEWHNQQGSDT